MNTSAKFFRFFGGALQHCNARYQPQFFFIRLAYFQYSLYICRKNKFRIDIKLMKRKLIFIMVTVCLFICDAQAKTTYIPTCDNRITMIENGAIDSLTNQTHALSMQSKDGLITCVLAQQVVSGVMIKSSMIFWKERRNTISSQHLVRMS